MLRQLARRLVGSRPHTATLRSSAPPDETLLCAVAVLRALGGRITRYDGAEGTLEARVARRRRAGTVRVHVCAAERGTMVSIESNAPAWSTTRRLLARELAS